MSRLDRLEQLTGILRSGDYHVAGDLAVQLGISRRTLMRDLDVLKGRGYPIETDQGRGGGVRLNRHWGIGRLNLNYREVIDLLLSLAIMEKIESPIFLGNLKAVRNKLSLSFPPESRNRILSLRKRLLIGNLASAQVMETSPSPNIPSASVIYEAFLEMRCLELSYFDAGEKKTRRMVEPHYLMLNWPVWYLLAWDHLRHDVRCFRLDRISHAKNNGTVFKPRSKKIFTEGIEEITSAL
ncbi:MAG: WYL domain-containing protein [Pseudomonadales bacterium]|nr:WYL domain-containing protein [Pseudomonadales bacterium]